jgi:PAS domain S-box-containing protein
VMENILIGFKQLGGILDCLSMGCIMLSLDRRILGINRSAEQLTDRKAADVIGKFCYAVFRDYLCGGSCRYMNGLQTPGGGFEVCAQIEITDHTSDGHSITKIEAPITGPDQRPVGCLQVFQDQTVFKALIRRIRYDDLRLKIILDNLDIGVLTVDRGGHITFFNTMAEKITGYSRKRLLGTPCSAVFGRDLCRAMRTIPAGDSGPSGLETRIVTRQGQSLPVRVNCMSLKNEKGITVGGLSTLTDLSLKYQFNSAIQERYTFFDMVGKDPVMQKIFEIVPVIAASEATILIEGPTGTGKDLLAKIIHNAGPRASKPLVKVNCAALPDTLLESEFFGYVKGAFTGADQNKPGRFQEADGGTIFLDEIGDLPLSLQAKLLRVLEDKEFYPLGSRRTTKVDVRIISASNLGLEKLVHENRFRKDLFYRLNVMRLDLPPLKDRQGDLPLLIAHVLKRLCATRNTQVERIAQRAMEVLLNHDYPGNIRELENILEHALIVCQGKVVERRHLPGFLLKNGRGAPPQSPPGGQTPPAGGEHPERDRILQLLRDHDGNRSKTARALKINRTTLWRKMKRYGIDAREVR